MDNYFSTGQAKNIEGSFAGRILIATPSLDDSIFEHSLIFLCAHDAFDGSLGVIFNKPYSQISTEELKAQLKIKKQFQINKKYTIFNGGPVDEDKLFILSATKEQRKQFNELAQLTLYTNAEAFLRDVIQGKQKNDFIVCKGFSSWAPGQLEQEIEENSWILADINFSEIFSGDPSKKWSTHIKKVGIKKPEMLVPYSGNA